MEHAYSLLPTLVCPAFWSAHRFAFSGAPAMCAFQGDHSVG